MLGKKIIESMIKAGFGIFRVRDIAKKVLYLQFDPRDGVDQFSTDQIHLGITWLILS